MAATKDLFERYKKFVENNVETVGHLESAARILSYIVPGIVFCDAFIWSELLTTDTLLQCSGGFRGGGARRRLPPLWATDRRRHGTPDKWKRGRSPFSHLNHPNPNPNSYPKITLTLT